MRIRERPVKFTSSSDLEANGVYLSDNQDSPAKAVELSALKGCIVGALELLPETYREIYIRREVLGDTAQVVASELQLSLSAVKSRLHRSRAMMRDSLDAGLGCRGLVESNL